jgi:CubicO group peptidase (beta-lactamase class C family)
VLGAVLEKASGKKYAALLQELVVDPLGLRDTRLRLDANPQLPLLHTLQEGDFRDSTYWSPSFVSWAAVTSNICDLVALAHAIGKDRPTVVALSRAHSRRVHRQRIQPISPGRMQTRSE